MDLSSSDEEECQLEFWNNWEPNTTHTNGGNQYTSRNRVPRQILSDFSRAATVISSVEDPRFGNWIPPPNFLYASGKDDQNPVQSIVGQVQKTKPRQKQLLKNKESPNTSGSYDFTQKVERISEKSAKTSTCTLAWRKEINFDWGGRIQLHDLSKSSDRNLFWGIVDLGIFGKIQLSVNEYGHMCCLASGKVTRIGSSESSLISINNTEILRKMLTVSSDQWASLCETVKETKTVLKFNAFEECDMSKSSSLEKLWFFLCKRRHFLPSQCMLVKFSGVVKCMRKLEITPKLVVQEIRYIQ